MHEPGSKSTTTTTAGAPQGAHHRGQAPPTKMHHASHHGSTPSLGGGGASLPYYCPAPPSHNVPVSASSTLYRHRQQMQMRYPPGHAGSAEELALGLLPATGSTAGVPPAGAGTGGGGSGSLGHNHNPLPNPVGHHNLPHQQLHHLLHRHQQQPQPQHNLQQLPQQSQQQTQQCKKNLQKMMGISPSDIDKYSRIFFPVTFTCFNLMYWIIYLHVSDEIAEDLVMLHEQ